MALKLIQEHPAPSLIFLATIVYIAAVKIVDFRRKRKGVKPVRKVVKEGEEEEEFYFTEES